MLPKEISGLQHPLVKDLTFLRSDRAERARKKQVVLIGEKMIHELALKTPLEILITTAPAPNLKAKEKFLATEPILQKISGLPSTDGFIAVAQLPEPQEVTAVSHLLILDRISDPGNLGTLLRTALALGWGGVLFTPGTVDPFNDKALRASKGALFSLPYGYMDQPPPNRRLYLADMEGKPLHKTKIETPLALILSHEATGSAPWAEKCAEKISIPMHNGVESLNVAASGAIFLYEMKQP
jgi:TrmH family RNA methyltransferase